MLVTDKSIRLDGFSEINGAQVVHMSKTISENSNGNMGSDSFVQNTINTELYEANKKAVRKDIAEFQARAYEIEDQLAEEAEAATK